MKTVQTFFVWLAVTGTIFASEEYLHLGQGTLPIVISAPHGGNLAVPGVPPRTGEGLQTGPAGFFTARDSGTEELALLLVEKLEERFQQKPSYVVSRVHRKFVDFNRPPAIAVEHERTRVIYDTYHQHLKMCCRDARSVYGSGLLLDVHGQGSSSVTVFRGTKNGQTVTALTSRFGEQAHTGENCFFSLLKQQGWTVFPDPFDRREQSGFTGGYIVQTYGSHRGDGIDAVQLEFGSRYRTKTIRELTANQLADAVVKYAELYLPDALSVVAGTSGTP